MNKIIKKEALSENVVRLVIEAPFIAKKRKAGHFVMVRINEKGERIPLTISDSDPINGTISLVIQKVGVTSAKLTALNVGDEIVDILGPLGKATHIENFGTVLCCGGGVGIAPLLPIVKELYAAGNKVISVIAGRTKELVILEKEINASSFETIIMTDDGSYGRKGIITEGMEDILKREKIDQAIVIGPAVMMKYASMMTKKYEVPTFASLNTIMVDGTGMCGGCRVTVGNENKFVCVDGPEFDAHQVNFDEMLLRLTTYKKDEIKAFDDYCKS